jgi:cysteine desulfurase/selenocysteine lyase
MVSPDSTKLPLPASEIPALQVEAGEERPCYLDNGATTLKPEKIIEAVAHFYRHDNAPVHRGVYEWSGRATNLYEQARETVGTFVGASSENVIFTRGTTEGLNLIAHGWGTKHLGSGDEILLSPQEHHSNFLPWRELAERTGATITWIPLLPDGRIDLDQAVKAVSNRTALVTTTHVSNVLGIENPVRELFAEARQVGATTILDAAQSVPTRPVDFDELNCDALSFSGHKMLGPTGIGALVATTSLLETMAPYQTGGGMIQKVSLEETTYGDGVERFEAGTPNAAGAIGLAAACDYLSTIGMENVEAYEADWGRQALEQIRDIPDVHLIGPPEDHAAEGGIISLRMKGLHPHDLAVMLDARGVMCRAGHHCTMPLHDHLGGDSSLRASGYIYNTTDDIERLVDALTFAHRALHGKVSTPF